MKRRTNNSGNGHAENRLFEDDFFIPFDGSLFDDIKDRKLTPTEFCIYAMLLRQADFETGIWMGSAYRICIGWGGQLNQRTLQDGLKWLGVKKLIKSFHRRGQRCDYAVAIHDYPIRFGKWRGYRLDAIATTDPKRPTYRPDRTSAPKPLRSDSVSTANSLRNDNEETANSIARNTPEYSRQLEHPDIQEEQDATTASTVFPRATRRKRAEPDADVGADAGCIQTPELRAESDQATRQTPLHRGQFMGAIRRIWHRVRGTANVLNATAAHIDAAVLGAMDVGEGVFLSIWNYWLIECGSELNVPAGEKWQNRAWPLDYFVTSGALHEYANTVRPFAGLAEDETLIFLVNAQRRASVPISLTKENLAILSASLRDWLDYEELRYQYEGGPMDTFVTEVVVPLAAKEESEYEGAQRGCDEGNNKQDEIGDGSSSSSHSSSTQSEGVV